MYLCDIPTATYLLANCKYVLYAHWTLQGRGNDFFLRGAQLIRKMMFCEFSKILLYKSPILRGARAPLAPLGPPALNFSHGVWSDKFYVIGTYVYIYICIHFYNKKKLKTKGYFFHHRLFAGKYKVYYAMVWWSKI